MSTFMLKIIAIIAMLLDHTGYIIFNKFSFFNYIGRLAFPIFAFLITEGYSHTSNLKKYLYRLTLFAIISQIPYMLFTSTFNNTFNLNILFTLILGLISIIIYNKINNKILGFLLVTLVAILAQIFPFDYGWFGIAIMFIFHIFKNKKLLLNLYFIIATFINFFFKFFFTSNSIYLVVILFTCFALIPINLYNEKKGKSIKYFFYAFYPLHLITLYILNFII